MNAGCRCKWCTPARTVTDRLLDRRVEQLQLENGTNWDAHHRDDHLQHHQFATHPASAPTERQIPFALFQGFSARPVRRFLGKV